MDEPNVERLARDFKFLLKAVAGSYGELELAFRKGRLSVYYRGNSLAVIVFRPAGKYRIDIHKRFLDGLDPKTRAEFTLAGSYGRVTVDARGAHRILQHRNVGRLMKAIRDVNHSEELIFEQILIADNPPSREFLLIDRQVTDHHMHRRLDLLGLRRLESGRYGFVVIEVSRYLHVPDNVPLINRHPCAASRLPLRSTGVPLLQDEQSHLQVAERSHAAHAQQCLHRRAWLRSQADAHAHGVVPWLESLIAQLCRSTSLHWSSNP